MSLFRIGTLPFCPPRLLPALELGQYSCSGSTASTWGRRSVKSAHEDRFRQSEHSTLGLEWELALVDAASRRAGPRWRTRCSAGSQHAHPELQRRRRAPAHQAGTAAEHRRTGHRRLPHRRRGARRTWPSSLAAVREVTDPHGRRAVLRRAPIRSATPQLQPITDKERYAKLIDRTQWWGRQMLIYGVHVHVGLDQPGQGDAGPGRPGQLLPALPGALRVLARSGPARTPATPRTGR